MEKIVKDILTSFVTAIVFLALMGCFSVFLYAISSY